MGVCSFFDKIWNGNAPSAPSALKRQTHLRCSYCNYVASNYNEPRCQECDNEWETITETMNI